MPDRIRSREDLLRILQANRVAIRGYGVRRLGLFGSYASGEATEASDIDLVVEFEKKTFDAYRDLQAFLEGLFQRRIDLVLADAVKPRLQAAIVEAAVYTPGSKLYLEDILEAIAKIQQYTEGLSIEMLSGDPKTLGAVARNLEVISEAVKMLPEEIRSGMPEREMVLPVMSRADRSLAEKNPALQNAPQAWLICHLLCDSWSSRDTFPRESHDDAGIRSRRQSPGRNPPRNRMGFLRPIRRFLRQAHVAWR